MKIAMAAVFSVVLLGVWVCDGVADLPVRAPSGDAQESESTPDPTEARGKIVPREPAPSMGPISVFADIEEGWKREDFRPILRHYPDGKVAIAIEGSGPTGGQFSRNQSHYLFQDLFKYTITEKFEFVQYRHVADGQGKVYAVAERYYKRNDDGRLFKDKIYVALNLEEERWVISEIKSVR